jgi:uroporphyrin-III C-methyltransferase
MGKVYLVGAGPGDPGLLTLRGREVLERCDTVVYDALVNPAILDFAPPEAERIDAGKRCGRSGMTQPEIHSLLIARARRGEIVVRLKGGDPFLFGRGGEEALALSNAGVEWEAAPGVSSALAAPAAAGIPVTHRGLSSSLAVLTAHDPGRVDWRAAAAFDTVVFLMAWQHLEKICEGLRDQGRAGETPAAVIQYGSWPEQRAVAADLASIAPVARAEGLGPPAVLVVGDVVSLAEKLRPECILTLSSSI